MSPTPATSYDELPYADRAFYYTHPDWLATLATIRGMQPAPADCCRVLELGCGGGGNLLPMAEALPQSQFVGIDLSPRQIAGGQAFVDALGLRNITLKAMSILDVDASFGKFDYIICHGVFSWVPPAVQDKILSICQVNLAPQGVAYVSYNTYPGWHLRGMVRDMLCYHARQFDEPRVCVQEARAFLDFLVESVPDKSYTVYATLLKEEADLLGPEDDTYLFHEHLEDVNQPFYFYQFAQRAAARELQYLEEARFYPLAVNLPASVKSRLAQFSEDPLRREQYVDFICRRTFRRTLLCHGEVTLNRALPLELLSTFFFTTSAKPVSAQPDLHSTAVEEFRTNENVAISPYRPLAKAALAVLSELHPRPIKLDRLWELIQARLGETLREDSGSRSEGSQLLAQFLFQCFLSNLVELQMHVSAFVTEVSERPLATPLARLQASADSRVTNRRHRGIELGTFDRLVLRHLDGSLDQAALLDILIKMVEKGDWKIEKEAMSIQDPAQVCAMLTETLDRCLHSLARSTLLVG